MFAILCEIPSKAASRAMTVIAGVHAGQMFVASPLQSSTIRRLVDTTSFAIVFVNRHGIAAIAASTIEMKMLLGLRMRNTSALARASS